jgi:hypothetical protein
MDALFNTQQMSVTTETTTKNTKVAAKPAISSKKVEKIIADLFNADAIKARETVKDSIKEVLELLDSYPSPAVLENPDDLKRFKAERSAVIQKYKKDFEEYTRKSRACDAPLPKAWTEEAKAEARSLAKAAFVEYSSTFNKTELKLFSLYTRRKNAGTGSFRVNKILSTAIADFLNMITKELINSSIEHMVAQKTSTLTNKLIFGPNIEKNKYFSLYQGLPVVAKYRANAAMELADDVSHQEATKKAQSQKQAKKKKPATKINITAPPTRTIVAYELAKNPNVKLVGCVGKIWDTCKGGNCYKIALDSRGALGTFVYEFATDLVRALKVHLDASEKITFKPIHFLHLMETLSILLHVDIYGFLKQLREEIEASKKSKKGTKVTPAPAAEPETPEPEIPETPEPEIPEVEPTGVQ